MADPLDQFASTPSDPLEQFAGSSASESETPDYSIPAAVAGGVGLAAAGYYGYKNPGSVLGKILNYANAARQQLMLSGLALPKSILGNVGAVTAKSIEDGSLSPLKAFFSPETWQDAKTAYREGSTVGPAMGQLANTNIPGPMPGRLMGAMDSATQGALRRSGSSAKEAEAALFQTPLGENFGPFAKTLDSPVARYVFPFRRTPYNQLSEGLKTVKPDYAHKGVTAGYAAAGAIHGAATSDEQYPVTIPLAAAGAAKYGVPYAGAALVGRYLAGGKGGGGVAGTILPASEYGLEQSLTDPLAPFVNPSAARVLKKFGITN